MPASIAHLGLPFSHTDAAIIGFLMTHPGWYSSEEIAEAIHETYGQRLRTLLTNLADRCYLDACTGKGYRLKVRKQSVETNSSSSVASA